MIRPPASVAIELPAVVGAAGACRLFGGRSVGGTTSAAGTSLYSLLLAPVVPKSSNSTVHLPSSDMPLTDPLMGTAG